MNPILQGTALAHCELRGTDDAAYASDMLSTRQGEAEYARVYELRGASYQPVAVPGVVVVSLDEEIYDEELDAFLPTTMYWVVAGQDVTELSEHAGTNLRLGNVLGYLDFAEHAGEWSESLEGLRRLAAAGCVANAETVLERLELLSLEVEVLCEEYRARRDG